MTPRHELRARRSADWRSMTANPNRIRTAVGLVLECLAGRAPEADRKEAGHWQVTALDTSGRRVLAAEITSPVPDRPEDAGAVVVALRVPILLSGETMTRLAGAVAAW